jgi:hypothetical protein
MTKAKPEVEKKGRSGATTWAQRVRMLEWLEMPPGRNFKLVTGGMEDKDIVAGYTSESLISYYK